jgi:hypothetical protein
MQKPIATRLRQPTNRASWPCDGGTGAVYPDDDQTNFQSSLLRRNPFPIVGDQQELLLTSEQLRQLGDVGGDPPRLVGGEPLGRLQPCRG